MERILLVEDDSAIYQPLTSFLRGEGFAVRQASGQREALALLETEEFDLVLLDVGLRDGNGFSVCTAVKQRGGTAVIFLSASGDEYSVVTGLDLGADDYITKPFSLSVLRARVNTQLRKAAAMSEKEKDNEHVYRKEPYVFDFDRMKFMVDGKEIELSKTEQKLLRILVENAGMNMRRELLLDRVWSDGAEYVDENALSVSVKRLRDKLGAEHAIRTVYGIGYRWE